jgi:hypothetical protein
VLFAVAAVERVELGAGSAEGAMLAEMLDLRFATRTHKKGQREEALLHENVIMSNAEHELL